VTRVCLACRQPLPMHNHGAVRTRCAVAYKMRELGDRDADSILDRAVREEADLLPWERHPIPWDHVRPVGGAK
jgi:LSD1 subclass zinc finger protein